jgi:hypothetical protein
VGKPEEKTPLGGQSRRWNNNVRLHLKETGREVVYWIDLSQVRHKSRAFVKTVSNILVL